jgi:hypothetical protein
MGLASRFGCPSGLHFTISAGSPQEVDSFVGALVLALAFFHGGWWWVLPCHARSLPLSLVGAKVVMV